MESHTSQSVDDEPEGPLWPYFLLNGVAILNGIAGVIYLGVGVFVLFADKGQAGTAFSAGLLFLVAGLLLWAICDLGVRLRRLEREQRQMRYLLDRQFRQDS